MFADLSDPVLFPRLSGDEIEQLAERGERRTFETDELLFEQGIRDAPFFVIEHGTIDIVDRRLEEDVWFARLDGGTFIGDVSMFIGEPTVAAGVAAEPSSVIVFERPVLRAMLAELPEFGELVLQTITARRAWLEGNDVGVLRLLASRTSGRAFEVRDLLDRIERAANVEIVPNREVAAVHGDGGLEAVSLRERDNGRVQRIPTGAVFVMIGATPCTDFVGSMLAVDDAGFVLCGAAARDHGWTEASREPHLLETVRPGVFVAGDVRSESTQRVAGAVGDGALAVRFAHQVLDS